jgi:hypothetical protein
MVISDGGKKLNDKGLEGKPWGIVVDFRDNPVSSVFIKRKICFSDPCFVTKSNLCEIS